MGLPTNWQTYSLNAIIVYPTAVTGRKVVGKGVNDIIGQPQIPDGRHKGFLGRREKEGSPHTNLKD